MHLSTLVGWQLARTVAVICSGLLAGMMVPCTAAALTNTPPTITRQPVGNIAGVGESYVFTVVATGTTPFTYQWQFNGLALGGATDSRLVLTNLMVAQSGNYSVIVSNIAGRMISSNAVLAVETSVTRRLGTGRILQFGSLVGVPILLRANGQEHAVSFSLGYDTNAYSNPTFVTRYTNATVDLNLTQPGVAGLAMTLPAAETFQAGYRILGLMRFQLAPGSNNLQGGLVFTTKPVPIAAVNSTAEVLQISASIRPNSSRVTLTAQLNSQSGLFEQKVVISNPGATIMTNLNIAVYGLGMDSLSNSMTFFNAHSNLVSCPLNDCEVYVECDCSCDFYDPFWGFCYDYECNDSDCTTYTTGTTASTPVVQINNLLPGESRELTMEYYVPDHFTLPRPRYSLYLADPLGRHLPVVTPLTITGSRYTDGVFLVEFMTKLGHSYSIQYAATPGELSTNALTVKNVSPAVTGTGGSVQWNDNGPPKTESPPVNGTRFYRVLQSQ